MSLLYFPNVLFPIFLLIGHNAALFLSKCLVSWDSPWRYFPALLTYVKSRWILNPTTEMALTEKHT